MGVLDGVGGLIGAVAGAAEGGYNLWQQDRQYEYQKNLQERMFAREDNAVQRRAKDLEAAGLSPVLAAGSAASAGPVVSTNVPQSHIVDSAAGRISDVQRVLQMKAAVASTNEDIRAKQLQNDKTQLQNDLLSGLLVKAPVGMGLTDAATGKDVSGSELNALGAGGVFDLRDKQLSTQYSSETLAMRERLVAAGLSKEQADATLANIQAKWGETMQGSKLFGAILPLIIALLK